MIRLPLIITGGLVAAAAAVTPAIVGLTDNPSFSQQVPVRVPAHATLATFPTASTVGHERTANRGQSDRDRRGEPERPATTPIQSPRRSEPGRGDDRGRRHELEPGDDRGHTHQLSPGVHSGRGHEHSGGFDDGSSSSGRSVSEPGDDRGAAEGGRRGNDDG